MSISVLTLVYPVKTFKFSLIMYFFLTVSVFLSDSFYCSFTYQGRGAFLFGLFKKFMFAVSSGLRLETFFKSSFLFTPTWWVENRWSYIYWCLWDAMSVRSACHSFFSSSLAQLIDYWDPCLFILCDLIPGLSSSESVSFSTSLTLLFPLRRSLRSHQSLWFWSLASYKKLSWLRNSSAIFSMWSIISENFG